MNRLLATLVCWTLLGLVAQVCSAGVVRASELDTCQDRLHASPGRRPRRAAWASRRPISPRFRPRGRSRSPWVKGRGPQFPVERQLDPLLRLAQRPAGTGPSQAAGRGGQGRTRRAAGRPRPCRPAPCRRGKPSRPTPSTRSRWRSCTDSPDPRTCTAWEKRVRKRLDDASDIFEHHCRVRFEVVKVGHWDSDPADPLLRPMR